MNGVCIGLLHDVWGPCNYSVADGRTRRVGAGGGRGQSITVPWILHGDLDVAFLFKLKYGALLVHDPISLQVCQTRGCMKVPGKFGICWKPCVTARAAHPWPHSARKTSKLEARVYKFLVLAGGSTGT